MSLVGVLPRFSVAVAESWGLEPWRGQQGGRHKDQTHSPQRLPLALASGRPPRGLSKLFAGTYARPTPLTPILALSSVPPQPPWYPHEFQSALIRCSQSHSFQTHPFLLLSSGWGTQEGLGRVPKARERLKPLAHHQSQPAAEDIPCLPWACVPGFTAPHGTGECSPWQPVEPHSEKQPGQVVRAAWALCVNGILGSGYWARCPGQQGCPPHTPR